MPPRAIIAPGRSRTLPCLLVLLCLPLCLPLWKQFGTLQNEALNATMFGCVKYELAYSVLFSLGALLACLL